MNTVQHEKVRIGLVGAGNIGNVYLKHFKGGEVLQGELVALCDHRPEALARHPEYAHYADAETMFAEADLDAVIISVPHYDHVTLGAKALEAKLHTLVDKPIAVHKADAERLLAAHTDDSLILATMFNQRTAPKYTWLRERIADGTLGRIHRINWIITDWFRTQIYYRNGEWRATWKGEGGGVLLNQCPHQLDLWQWLFGMPKTVTAFGSIGRYHDIEVEDDVTAYMEYEDGTTGVFITSTGEAPGTLRLEVVAENGRVVIEHGTLEFIRNLIPTTEYSNTTTEPFERPETERITEDFPSVGSQHEGVVNNFVAAIQGHEELIAPAEEGIHSVELGNAMLFSMLQGQSVTLPLDGAAYERKLQELIKNSLFEKQTVQLDLSAEDMNDSQSK